MSQPTVASRHLGQVKADIKSALQNLGHVVVDECAGWDEYDSIYLAGLYDAYRELLKAKKLVGE